MKTLGLDLGISSIGWVLIDNNKLIDGGVRIFNKAENPKTRESLALPRRMARSQRRTTKRKRVRLRNIRRALIEKNILNSEDEFFTLFDGVQIKDIWQLRVEALNRKLDKLEFARVLYHIAKHRGFEFGSKSEEKEDKDSEKKEVLNAIKNNKNQIEDNKYLTYAEYIVNEFKKYRNGNGDYSHSISRDMLKDEIDKIFDKQIEFKNEFATKKLKEKYWQIANFTKPMQNIYEMVGYCTILGKPKNKKDENTHKKCAKASFSAELFIAVSKILNTTLVNGLKYEKLIDYISIDKILKLAYNQKKLTYKSIRKLAKLNEKITFKSINVEEEGKKVFIELKAYHILKDTIKDKNYFDLLFSDRDKFNEIGSILTIYKSDEEKRKFLSNIIDNNEVIEELLTLSFSGFINYSLKVIDDILPSMEKGEERDKTLLRYGYSEKKEYEKGLLPALNKTDIDITNPVVIRAMSELRKVVNAIVRKYGSFDMVHIELTKDINSKKERIEIEKVQKKNEKNRKEAKEFIVENFNIKEEHIKSKDILKVILWKEQQNRCIYSNTPIELNRLFENGYLEIDHILPYSRSLDDSISNRVLVLKTSNQNKKNQTPFEWFEDEKKDWQEFKSLVKNNKNFTKSKVKKLLKENFSDENSQKTFLDRNLNDTRYLSKMIVSYIKDYLKLNTPKKEDKLQVQVRNGRLISNLRHQWGLETKNRDNHLHHLEDAILIAFSTQKMVEEFANYIRNREYKKKVKFTSPYENFRDDVMTFLNKFEINEKFVSRPPRKKITGSAHKENPIKKNEISPTKRYVTTKNNQIFEDGEVKRIDVFIQDNVYYFLPISIAEFTKETLPNIALGKEKYLKTKIDSSFEFLFSLFKDDLVTITHISRKKEITFEKVYFTKLKPSNGQMNFMSHTSSNREEKSLYLHNIVSIKKLQISSIGDIFEVKQEKRLGVKRELKAIKKIKK